MVRGIMVLTQVLSLLGVCLDSSISWYRLGKDTTDGMGQVREPVGLNRNHVHNLPEQLERLWLQLQLDHHPDHCRRSSDYRHARCRLHHHHYPGMQCRNSHKCWDATHILGMHYGGWPS
jgi:hypothetical protein